MTDFPDVWGVRRDKIKHEYYEARDELKSQLRSYIKKFLRKKGFKPDWVKTVINGKVGEPYSKDIWVEPKGIIGLNFRYIYSDHVHFMIDRRRSDGSGLWSNIAIAKWYFNRRDFNLFYNKKIKPVIKREIEEYK